ncbi:MAG: glycosyl transferase family 1, partial [Casimicrobiaceae bacterium]
MSKLIGKIVAKGPLQLFRKTCESYAREGFATTLARIGHFVKDGSDGASFIAPPENLGYVDNRDAQDRYVRAYAKVPSKVRRLALERLLANERGYRGIVIYPAAYDLSLRQRPEHVLRVLADQGYVCIIVTVGGDEPVVRKRGQRLYECNLYEDVLTHFASLPIVLYITAPMHRYVADLLPLAFVVYDVLDRLEIFAHFCNAMVEDHEALLARADLVMCTSKALFERTSAMATNVHLVPNGVFPDDFSPAGQPDSMTPLVIGYHGVISELLDFDLLDRLAALPGVELLFAGSVNAFITSNALPLQACAEALFSRSNVTHLGVLGYDELRSYLSRIHCGLVPFVLNPSTDAVSPLKFFEFVAAGKPVLTTPTKTMREYADFALVADADAIVAAVEQGNWNRMVPSRHAALTQQHAWHVLVAPMTAALQEQDLAHAVFPVHGDQTRVDIVNFNFFDWHGDSVYKGGAERYVLDLAHLCKRMGLRVRIVQNAHVHFERNFHGIDVVGVPIVDKLDLRAMSRGFVDVSRDAGLVIASPLDLASDLNPDQ